jgi:hypothetical protein
MNMKTKRKQERATARGRERKTQLKSSGLAELFEEWRGRAASPVRRTAGLGIEAARSQSTEPSGRRSEETREKNKERKKSKSRKSIGQHRQLTYFTDKP